MGKARRYPELVPVRGRQFQRHVASVTARADPDINGDVEDRATRTSDEFALRSRRRLIMQTSNNTLFRGTYLVVLHEGSFHAMLRQDVGAKGLGKEAARIRHLIRNDD